MWEGSKVCLIYKDEICKSSPIYNSAATLFGDFYIQFRYSGKWYDIWFYENGNIEGSSRGGVKKFEGSFRYYDGLLIIDLEEV